MSTRKPIREGASALGRKPPPTQTRFKKGQSGNPAGRPKGAVSISGITEKFASKALRFEQSGRRQRLRRLDVVLRQLVALAASGSAAAAEELHKLRTKILPREANSKSAVLLVSEILSEPDWIAREEQRNKDKVEPGSAINLDAEEFIKAARGEQTVYGEALLEYYRKYRGTHD